ncbi:hypothetical protein PRUPE_6G138600 [Prunus persica]|uniref:Secoisolariciresinol dehydrogenase-like n=1 Tax=Prunus persica TaxID=3760 RepID=A0A251NQ49_PRUPE|nr:hypothetical protein PRUPE_6G138600 [Prunus persica]
MAIGNFSLLAAAARRMVVDVMTMALTRLEGKVAVITGGASGIGESTARLFSKHGAKVVIADVQDDLAESVCRDLSPSSTSFVHCDVTKEEDVENVVQTATNKYGKLDIMFNNAGIAGMVKPNILDNDKIEFEQVIRVNLVGAFLGIKHAARVMIPVGKGLVRNTAVELGQHGIRVNCVSPYIVSTPLVKEFFKLDDDKLHGVYSNLKGGVLKAEDIAKAALYLGSDESKYVSGHNLLVDGGFTIVNAGFCMFEQA